MIDSSKGHNANERAPTAQSENNLSNKINGILTRS